MLKILWGKFSRKKNDDGTFKGGPAFYINKTMKKPGLANLFSFIVCIVYGFMFAFSSIIGNYYYEENNILAMGLGNTGLAIYRVLVLIFVFLGAVGDFSVVWNTGDIFMGIMAIINLIILMIVGKAALATYYDYLKQLKSGKDPVFDPKNIKELSPYLDEITAWYVDENL